MCYGAKWGAKNAEYKVNANDNNENDLDDVWQDTCVQNFQQVFRKCTNITIMMNNLKRRQLRWLQHLEQMNVESLMQIVRETVVDNAR